MKKITTNKLQVYDSDNSTLRKEFYNDGFQNYEWNDVMPSGDWVDALGGSMPDITTHTIGGIGFNYKSFDGVGTEERFCSSFEIMHNIDIDILNSGVVMADIHTHGTASTSGSGVVKIFFDIVYSPINSAPYLWGTFSVLIPVNNERYYHKVVGVELPKPTGGYNIGDIIKVRYRRTPDDIEDTYTADWLFEQCAMHFPINSNGSRQRYIK